MPDIYLKSFYWENRFSQNFNFPNSKYTLFHKQYFYSAKPQCCWTFSWIKPKMLLRCCLIYITIIVLRHFMFRIFASMSRPRSISVASMWPIFYFNLTFIAINHITSIKQTHLFFVFFRICLTINGWWRDEEKK